MDGNRNLNYLTHPNHDVIDGWDLFCCKTEPSRFLRTFQLFCQRVGLFSFHTIKISLKLFFFSWNYLNNLLQINLILVSNENSIKYLDKLLFFKQTSAPTLFHNLCLSFEFKLKNIFKENYNSLKLWEYKLYRKKIFKLKIFLGKILGWGYFHLLFL